MGGRRWVLEEVELLCGGQHGAREAKVLFVVIVVALVCGAP